MTEIVIIGSAKARQPLARVVRALGYQAMELRRSPTQGRYRTVSAVVMCPGQGAAPNLAPVREVFGASAVVLIYADLAQGTGSLASLVALGADRILRAPISEHELQGVLQELLGPPASTPAKPPRPSEDELDLDAYGLDDLPDMPDLPGTTDLPGIVVDTSSSPLTKPQATARVGDRAQAPPSSDQPTIRVRRQPTRPPGKRLPDPEKNVYTTPSELLKLLWSLADSRVTGTLTINCGNRAAVFELYHGMLIEPRSRMQSQRIALAADGVNGLRAADYLAAGDHPGLHRELACAGLCAALRGEGSWVFSPGARARPPLSSLPALMLAATGRGFDASDLEQWQPASRCPLSDVHGLGSMRHALAAMLQTSNHSLLGKLDGTHTVEELVRVHGFERAELLAILRVLEAGQRVSWVTRRPKSNHTPNHTKIERALKMARQGDFLGLLGVKRDSPVHAIRAAYRQRMGEFDANTLDPTTVEDCAAQLTELRGAFQEAQALLCDEALRCLYLSHLDASFKDPT